MRRRGACAWALVGVIDRAGAGFDSSERDDLAVVKRRGIRKSGIDRTLVALPKSCRAHVGRVPAQNSVGKEKGDVDRLGNVGWREGSVQSVKRLADG